MTFGSDKCIQNRKATQQKLVDYEKYRVNFESSEGFFEIETVSLRFLF